MSTAPYIDKLAAEDDEALTSKIRKGENKDDCDIWTGAISSNGYPVVKHEGKTELATRVLWKMRTGSMPPDDKDMVHSCDEQTCMNPKHLKPGTTKQNVHDMFDKGRARPHGKSVKGMDKAADLLDAVATVTGLRRISRTLKRDEALVRRLASQPRVQISSPYSGTDKSAAYGLPKRRQRELQEQWYPELSETMEKAASILDSLFDTANYVGQKQVQDKLSDRLYAKTGPRVKEAFTTSQYSGPLGPVRFKQHSQLPPFRMPPPGEKTAFATTPAGRLLTGRSVGLPKVSPPPGPSISQVSKPVGFGKPLAGTTKTPG